MKIFITFGAGLDKFTDAANRLMNQVEKTGFFDKTILYSEKNLKNDKKFWNKHNEFILSQKRGYGYWIWKSYIIKKTMEQLKDGDIIMYLDSGCEIGYPSQDLIPDFFDYVKKDKIIGSLARNEQTNKYDIEKNWTKMDLIEELNIIDENLLDSPQHQAGLLMIEVCQKTIDLVNLWYKICCRYELIDDSCSKISNCINFVEHRHDQSIFSLLTKKYNLFSEKSMYDCVEGIRNRSGISLLE